MTGLLCRAPTEDHGARRTPDLTGLHPGDRTRAMAGTNPLAPGEPGDCAGVRTRDVAAAVVGAISPFGGPNGWALGLMIEARARTARGDDVRGTLGPTHPSTKGDEFVARELRASGHDRVPAPGARACASQAATLADAVPVSTSAQHIAADVPERH